MPVSGTLTYRTETEGVTFSNETVPSSQWPVDEIEIETPDHEDDNRMHPLLIRAHIQAVEASKEEILLRTDQIVEALIDRLALIEGCYVADPKVTEDTLQEDNQEGDVTVNVRAKVPVATALQARATVQRTPENTRNRLEQAIRDAGEDHPHFQAFRLALRDENVVQRYLGLYRILNGLCGSQKDVDEFIREQVEDVEESESPQTAQPETVFTRLRNEIGHYREHEYDEDIDLRETVSEMEDRLEELKTLVRTAIRTRETG